MTVTVFGYFFFLKIINTSRLGLFSVQLHIYNYITLSEIKCRTITITEQLQSQLNYATMHIKQFSLFKTKYTKKQFSRFKT